MLVSVEDAFLWNLRRQLIELLNCSLYFCVARREERLLWSMACNPAGCCAWNVNVKFQRGIMGRATFKGEIAFCRGKAKHILSHESIRGLK